MSSRRTGRIYTIFSRDELTNLKLSQKVTCEFGRGTERIPESIRHALLRFFQKAYQDSVILRAFLHPRFSPIDDSNLIDIAHEVEGPCAIDLNRGRKFVVELAQRYAFCMHSFALDCASQELVLDVDDVVDILKKDGKIVTKTFVESNSLEDLWELQGSRKCLFCNSKHLKWTTCTTCDHHTCSYCCVYRDIAFGIQTCGNCDSILIQL